MNRPDAVIRYVVTHVGKNGLRTLAHGAQGRNTYDTPEEAQAWIDAATANNSVEQLTQLFGLPLEVRACACWPHHHDPMGIYFDEVKA